MALVFKDVFLDLSKVPEDKKDEVKSRVADLLYNEVLRSISKGVSPVLGEGKFKILNKDYAEREKQGNRTANLQLEGDLIREDFASKALDKTDAVRIGHFNVDTAATQGEKADGHNQHTAKAQLWAESIGFPKRRYVPTASQSFSDDIMKRVERVIDKFRVSDSLDVSASIANDILRSGDRVTTTRISKEKIEISLDDFLSEDYLAELIKDRLK